MQRHNAKLPPLIPLVQILLTAVMLLLSAHVLAELPLAPEARRGDLSDYAQPIISIDEVLNTSSSMEGMYPTYTYGTYGGLFFWMDNQRIILSVRDDKQGIAVASWDIEKGKISRYGPGRVMCYANGKISKLVYQVGASPTTPATLQRGLLGQEQNVAINKGIRAYDSTFQCGEEPSSEIVNHLRNHPEDVVVALRPEHGFLVTAKRTMFPDGRTDKVLEQNEIVFFPSSREPVHIPMVPWLEGRVDAYYPFANAYTFANGVKGEMDQSISRTLRYRMNSNGEIIPFGVDDRSSQANYAFILSINGEVRKVKVPGILTKGVGVAGPYLSRKGIVWLGGSVLPNQGNGIYLSRGEQVKRISSENIRSGIISPNGCRLAYTTTDIDSHGQITKPVLKVIDLCTGEN